MKAYKFTLLLKIFNRFVDLFKKIKARTPFSPLFYYYKFTFYSTFTAWTALAMLT